MHSKSWQYQDWFWRSELECERARELAGEYDPRPIPAAVPSNRDMAKYTEAKKQDKELSLCYQTFIDNFPEFLAELQQWQTISSHERNSGAG